MADGDKMTAEEMVREAVEATTKELNAKFEKDFDALKSSHDTARRQLEDEVARLTDSAGTRTPSTEMGKASAELKARRDREDVERRHQSELEARDRYHAARRDAEKAGVPESLLENLTTADDVTKYSALYTSLKGEPAGGDDQKKGLSTLRPQGRTGTAQDESGMTDREKVASFLKNNAAPIPGADTKE